MNYRRFALFLAVAVALAGSAFADTIDPFTAAYPWAPSTPATVRIIGDGPTNQGVGTTVGLITGTSFDVTMVGGGGASDFVFLGAFLNSSPSGTFEGYSFTPFNAFPFNTQPLIASLQGLGVCGNGVPCDLSFGFVDIHTGLAPGGTLTVDITGWTPGTWAGIYGLALNEGTVTGVSTVTNISPNSESGIIDPPGTVPEPSSLLLMGTGLLTLGGVMRRKFGRK